MSHLEHESNLATCNCASKSVLLVGLKDPARDLALHLFKLVKSHPREQKYYYRCENCQQVWEKLSQPHHYGYSESWKKLEGFPNF